MKSVRPILLILIVALLLCGAWSAALRVLPRPALAESNYEANRLRMENWMLGPPAPAVLVGTSMTGRLLSSDFDGTPLAGLANLGLDGASPETGLRLTLLREPAPPLILLEVQLLAKRPGPNDRQLLELATGVGLQVSRYLPLTRADARPSTVLYAWMKSHQKGMVDAGGPERESSPAEVEDPAVAAENAAAMDQDWRIRMVPLLQQLQERGSRVVLVRLPAGKNNPVDPEALNPADLIAGELGLPLVDLLRWTRKEGLAVSYSDGLHLSPQSAAAVSKLMVKALEEKGLLAKIQPDRGGDRYRRSPNLP